LFASIKSSSVAVITVLLSSRTTFHLFASTFTAVPEAVISESLSESDDDES